MSNTRKITLRSSDGETFEVDEAVALESQKIKQMIEDDCPDNGINLSDVTSKILSKVIEYCKKHMETPQSDDRSFSSSVRDELKAWDAEFVKVDQATLFDLIKAADYLKIQSLLDLTCQTVADMIKGKTPEELRKFFNIKKPSTPEEEEEIRRENQWAFDSLRNITDWLSAIAVPVGAQFWNFGITTNSSKRKRLSNHASAGPPLLNEHNGSGVGVSVRKSNIMASRAHSVSVPRMQPRDITHGNCFNSFCQIILQLPVVLKLSLSGLHQVRKSRSPRLSFGALIFPVDFLQHFKASDTSGGPSVPTLGINTHERVSTGSISLKLEKNFDEYTGIDGWIETKNCNYRQVQWAVNVFDESEDEFGWGLSLSGMTETPNRLSRIQAETYLKLNMSKKFNLKPGVTYAIDGNAILFGLTLQSHWTF